MSNVRIIVELHGGLVSSVYSSSAKVDVSILDHDLEKIGEANMKKFKKLEKESNEMYEVY